MPLQIANPDMSRLKLYQVSPAPKLNSFAQRQKSVRTRNVLQDRVQVAAQEFLPGQHSITARSKSTFKNAKFLARLGLQVESGMEISQDNSEHDTDGKEE